MIPNNYNPLNTENQNFTLESLEYRRETPYAAKHLRLGFHGCMKNKDGTGGCNGCLNLQRMEDSLDWRTYDLTKEGRGVSGHEGLLTTVKLLEQIYTDPSFPPKVAPSLSASMIEKGMSRSDLWAFASILAVEMGTDQNNRHCEIARKGDEDNCLVYPVGSQRQSAHSGDCEFTMKLNIFQTGRADCTDYAGSYGFNSTSEEVHPADQGTGEETLSFYDTQFNLTAREAVVIQGAHSLGKPHRWNSGFDRYWTKKNQRNLNTQYYENIVNTTGFKLEDCPYRYIGDRNGNAAPIRWVPENRYARKGLQVTKHQWRKEYLGCEKCRSTSYGGKNVCETTGTLSGRQRTFEQACNPGSVKPSCSDTNGSPGVDCCNTEAPFCQESDYKWRVTEDMMLSSDIGLYINFTRLEDGRPTGCPGLDKPDAWKTNVTSQGTTEYRGGETGCQLNTQDIDGVPLHRIVEEYAEDDIKWGLQFPSVIKKMLSNGYSAEDLVEGPAVFEDVACIRANNVYSCTKA